MEFTKNDAAEYAKLHPEAKLSDFIEAIEESKKDEQEQCREHVAAHMGWVRQNLVGKHVIIKVERRVSILYITEASCTGAYLLSPVPEYEFSCDCDDWTDATRSYTTVKPAVSRVFNLRWVKSPFNRQGNFLPSVFKSYSAYVLPDDKYREIAAKLDSHMKLFNELIAFEDGDELEKVY